MTKKHKKIIYVLVTVALFLTFILWFFPVSAFTADYIEDCGSGIDEARKLVPSAYNLMFGGKKTFEGFLYIREIDYSNYVVDGLKFVFFLHLAITVSTTIVTVRKFNYQDSVIVESILPILLAFCGTTYFVLICTSIPSISSSLIGGIEKTTIVGFTTILITLIYLASTCLISICNISKR